MKRLFLLFFLVVEYMAGGAQSQQQPTFTEWHDLQVNDINRFPLHSDFFAYESLQKALKGDKSSRPTTCLFVGSGAITVQKMSMNAWKAFTVRKWTTRNGLK